MAINATILDMVLKVTRTVGPGCKLLCLGYSDMLVTEQQLVRICGADILGRVKFREDSEAILRWHDLQGQVGRIAETRSVFEAMDSEIDFVDIVASRGLEIVMDLNQPAPEGLHGRYDVVYDGGTMEHCFNVGQVMKNITAMTRTGGYIIHLNPLNFFNHGFFNFNPTFYYDFYTQSGNRIIGEFYALYGPVLESRMATLPAVQGGACPTDKSVVMVVAQKTSDKEPSWPMQTKYLNNAALEG
jgi:hypothetical protein